MHEMYAFFYWIIELNTIGSFEAQISESLLAKWSLDLRNFMNTQYIIPTNSKILEGFTLWHEFKHQPMASEERLPTSERKIGKLIIFYLIYCSMNLQGNPKRNICLLQLLYAKPLAKPRIYEAEV